MSRSSQQHLRLIQELVRLVQRSRYSGRILIGLIVLAVAYLLLRPVLVRSLGVELPGIGELAGIVAEAPQEERAEKTSGPSQERNSTSGEIEAILSGNSRKTYVSPAGLRYGRGSQQGHRLKHLMKHATDQPDRPGQHGVFDATSAEEIVAVVDEAYKRALADQKTEVSREGDRTVYTVDLGKQIGFIGGESGNRRGRPSARHVRLVVEGKDFITAFPYRR